jgi:glyoxylase-like metal-dependent hydrolase (beta-lactamase superfamily II)
MSTPLTLEDFYEDIIGKAQRGLGLSDADLIAQTGLTAAQLTAAQDGQFDQPVARKLAMVLNLNADALVASGQKSWHPSIDSPPQHFWQVTTDYKGVMTVNAYIVAQPETGDALIFDSGADAHPILDILQHNNLCATALLITHNHGDHVTAVPTLKQELAVPVFAVETGASCDRPFSWGNTLKIAGFEIHCHQTSGHAPDGTTFSLQLDNQPIAITGDALFAGSMGGANHHWQEALTHTRQHILSLPESTLLCPGHGPITSVQLEQKHNPFFLFSHNTESK